MDTEADPPELATSPAGDRPANLGLQPRLRDTGQREALKLRPDGLGGEGSVHHRTCVCQAIEGGFKAPELRATEAVGKQAEIAAGTRGMCRCHHSGSLYGDTYLRSHRQSKGSALWPWGGPLMQGLHIFHFSPKGRVILFSKSLKHVAEEATGLSDVLHGTVQGGRAEGEGPAAAPHPEAGRLSQGWASAMRDRRGDHGAQAAPPPPRAPDNPPLPLPAGAL